MAKVLVLGAGMVGSVIAADLAAARGMRVTVVDRSAAALARARERAARVGGLPPQMIEDDASDRLVVGRLAAEHDLVIGALPSRFGFETLRAVIEAGRSCVDISFMPEDFLELHRVAKRRGVTAVPDCGVAPGMSNMLAGWGAAQLTRPTRIRIMVGGLPRERHWPFEYKAAFSPHDVIEEYTRPSRIVRGGRVEVREALSEPELVTLPGAGTLEAFLTDGLRSLVKTLRVPDMEEKTLRYPGHIELMRVMRAVGLFSEEEVEIGSARLKPRDLVAALMFPKWTYEPGEHDLTVMRVEVEGHRGGTPTRLVWDLFDGFDPTTGFTSMARTTGFPATSMARLILAGRVRERGVLAPEQAALGRGVLAAILRDMAERGVRYMARAEQMGVRQGREPARRKASSRSASKTSAKTARKAASRVSTKSSSKSLQSAPRGSASKVSSKPSPATSPNAASRVTSKASSNSSAKARPSPRRGAVRSARSSTS
ncbi:MAG: saccharopine dehydrogenase NADP-binding domain-containing protein [Phycisphaeraceae bacterium]|nr:saccharopine dehydrogenase NADP-binding domain-containing protein [Phycisphaeraceae bacterium]